MRIQDFLLLAILAAAANAADLRVAHHSIRQDRSVVSPEEWQWNEGWPRVRQFFPRYFKPAATAHLDALLPAFAKTVDDSDEVVQRRVRMAA